MTMAVEDSARLRPMSTAAPGARAEQRRDQPDDDGRDRHLQRAEPEHQAAHGDEPLERQLEPDDEQQEDDAQLGDGAEALLLRDGDPVQRRDVARQRAEPVRAEHGAGDEEAEDGAELEALADAARARRPSRARSSRRGRW